MLTFNAGNCCGHAAARSIDDVAFTRLVLDDLAGVASVDRRRVFATGMSNGATMSYRLAAEMSDRIAAIALVGGPMGTEECRPQRAVSVMHFHGDADEYAPFKGGRGRSPSGTDFFSVQHSIDAWVAANGYRPAPVTTRLPDRADDGTTVKEIRHESGRDGAEVVLVVIEGGGHTWPGREPRLRALGTSTRDISANDTMREFFQRHPEDRRVCRGCEGRRVVHHGVRMAVVHRPRERSSDGAECRGLSGCTSHRNIRTTASAWAPFSEACKLYRPV
jgi:polyhydroxybutyrate depolymerase